MVANIICCLLAASAALLASEVRVQMKDLPAPVQRTVKEQIRSAKLRGLTKEVENGRTYYEAETIANGKTRDVLIDAGGNVVEVEEEIALSEVPEQARAGLEKLARGSKIVRVEAATRGSALSYEAVVQKNGKKREIAVNLDGTPKR
jgi:uncharacterized membrane protein YkoI